MQKMAMFDAGCSVQRSVLPLPEAKHIYSTGTGINVAVAKGYLGYSLAPRTHYGY